MTAFINRVQQIPFKKFSPGFEFLRRKSRTKAERV